MSDVVDVQSQLASICEGVVYPNGTSAAPIAGAAVSVFPGWPNATSLDAMLAKNQAMVTVFPKNIERNTTRYSRQAQVIQWPVPTLTLAVSGATITVGGLVSTPQNAGLLVNGRSYVRAVQANDTLTTVATALAGLVAADIAGTTNSGPVITLGAGVFKASAVVGASGVVATEVARQERVFGITVWAPTQAIRDQLAAAIDVAVKQMDFIALPDGFKARILYHNSTSDDGLQKANLYRRDLNYSVEYATTVETPAAAVLFPVTQLVDQFNAVISDTTA